MENTQDANQGRELGKFYRTQMSETDRKIHNDVLVALKKAPMIDASRIEVAVKDGVVFLDGYVADIDKREAATKVIENLIGVEGVDNCLEVQHEKLKEQVVNQEHKVQNEKTIEKCLSCYQRCVLCLNHCLQRGGEHSSPDHVKKLLECAEICNFTSKLILMEAEISYGVGQLCAKACEICADSCQSLDPNDEVMAACIESCVKCAEACRSMDSYPLD